MPTVKIHEPRANGATASARIMPGQDWIIAATRAARKIWPDCRAIRIEDMAGPIDDTLWRCTAVTAERNRARVILGTFIARRYA